MIDHHIQKTIVHKLALAETMRFSELQPDDIDNKLFDYHLKKTISSGLVEKSSEGVYRLTAKGRLYGLRALEGDRQAIDKAESVLFLVVQNGNQWLMYRRHSHPLRNQIGFMHAYPVSNEIIEETAKRECLEKTGLTCNFKALGSGYFRIYRNQELESFTHFTLLFAEEISGALSQSDELADYFWLENPDFSSPDMLPNMPILGSKYSDRRPFQIEESFHIS